MRSLIVSMVLVSILVGCSGPLSPCGVGTVSERGQCVVASNDAGDDEQITIEDGATLIGLPDAISIGVNMQACFDAAQLSIFHADGGTTPLSPNAVIRVTRGAPAMVAAAAGDCRVGGVTGSAVGAGIVQIEVVSPVRLAPRLVPFTVGATTFSFVQHDVVIGSTAATRYDLDWTFGVSFPPTRGMTLASLAPSELELHSADPSIVKVTVNVDSAQTAAVMLTGVMAGTTVLTGRYGPPGDASALATVATVTVAGSGALRQLTNLQLDVTGSGHALDLNDGPLTPGTCLEPHLFGQFLDGASHTFSTEVTGAAWSVSSNLTWDSAQNRSCAVGAGDAVVTGCSGAACLSQAFVVYPVGFLTGLNGAPAQPSAHRGLVATGASTYADALCIDITITAHFSDGTQRDVTDSPALIWAGESLSPFPLPRLVIAGTPFRDGNGWPCFDALELAQSMSSHTQKAVYGRQFVVVDVHW